MQQNMDITEKQVEMVKTIAMEKNISKAAEKLYISQPGLTKALNELEKNLGEIRLFDRSLRPVELTLAGRLYLEKADQILSLMRELESELSQLQEYGQGTIRLGISYSRYAAWISPITTQLKRLFPGYKLSVVECEYTKYQKLLLEKKLDLVISRKIPFPSKKVEERPIRMEELLIVCDSQSPLVSDRVLSENSVFNPLSIDVQRLQEDDLILPGSEGLTLDIEQQLLKNGFNLNRKIVAKDHLSAYMMAAAGAGYTILPTQLLYCNKFFFPDATVFCSLPQRMTRQFYFYYSKNDPHLAILEAIMNAIMSYLERNPNV